MKKTCCFRWLRVAAMLLTAAFSIQNAMAACSSYSGKVVINEYNYIDNWIELKILDTSAITASGKFADWKLWVFKQSKPGSPASQDVGSMYTNIADNTCGTASTQYYIRIPFDPKDLDNDVNVVLADANKDIVDVFRLDQTSPLTSYFSGFNSCSISYGNLTDGPPTGTASNKDIARMPDGTGPWVISPGTGNNSQNTLCGSNDGTLALTKTPSSASVGIGAGSTFTWTFTVKNGGAKEDLTNVTLTDTLPANMYLASCPAGATCGGAAGAYTSLTQNVGTLAAGASASVVATAYVTASGTYTNTVRATATELNPGYTEATGTVQTLTVGSFNAFETSTAANAITGVIRTKIAGSAFDLAVVAISNGAQASSFNDNVKVELLANTGAAGSGYGTDNCPASNTVLQTLASAAISNGRSTVSFGAVANSYRDVRVRISYPTTSPTVTSCSTDSFAIRPSALSISATDQDWQTAGTANTLNVITASGSPIHKAGQPFTVRGSALNAATTPVVTTNYSGAPTASLSACSGTACTSILGTFTLGGSFSTGSLSTITATYSEVGSFNLQLQDATYANIDSADTTGDCSATGYYVCSPMLSVGRIVPDHFDTAVVLSGGVPMACASGVTCPSAYNGMVYSGQPFSVQVTARNAAGSTLVNYNSTTGLSRDVTLTAWNALGATGTSNQNPAGNTTSLSNAGMTAGSFSAGVATSALPSYAFVAAPTIPTAIYLRATDTDNVSSLRSSASSSVEGGVGVVSGRIRLNNVYGSELLPLTLTASAEFYQDATSGWVASSNDNSSQFSSKLVSAGGNVQPTILQGPLAIADISVQSPGTSKLSGGVASFTLAAPGAGHNGRAELTLSAPDYLMTAIPGTATFGVYNPGNRLIYRREQY